MNMWTRKNYVIIPVEHHHDLYKFEVIQNGEIIAIISPSTLSQQNHIISALNDGEDINGWDDCNGNTIYVHQ